MPELLPCPRCGRKPTLRRTTTYHDRTANTTGPLYIGARYTCRGFWRVFTCVDAPYQWSPDGWHWNNKDWSDYPAKRAAETWNKRVMELRALRRLSELDALQR